MKKEYLTKSAGQTKKLGETLAKTFSRSRSENKAIVIGLKGDLGGGKTTFLQGFAKGLGIKERVLSPTFIVMRRMKLDNCSIDQLDNFFHIDAYRIRDDRDLLGLGFREIVANSKNVVAIEWADKIKQLLPKNTILIEFEVVNKNSRKIVFDK